MPFVAGRPLEPEASMPMSPERCWCRNSPRNSGLFSMTDASNALMKGCSAKDEDGNMGFAMIFVRTQSTVFRPPPMLFLYPFRTRFWILRLKRSVTSIDSKAGT